MRSAKKLKNSWAQRTHSSKEQTALISWRYNICTHWINSWSLKNKQKAFLTHKHCYMCTKNNTADSLRMHASVLHTVIISEILKCKWWFWLTFVPRLFQNTKPYQLLIDRWATAKHVSFRFGCDTVLYRHCQHKWQLVINVFFILYPKYICMKETCTAAWTLSWQAKCVYAFCAHSPNVGLMIVFVCVV